MHPNTTMTAAALDLADNFDLSPAPAAVTDIADRMAAARKLAAADDLRRLMESDDGAQFFRAIDNEINLHFGEPEFAVSFASATDRGARATIALQYALMSAVFNSRMNVIYIDGGSDAAALARRMHLGLEPVRGVYDVMAGETPVADCLRATALPNLRVVAGGSAAAGHTVFSTKRFNALIAEAKERGDRVILDLPPLATNREALGMVRAVPDCVLVIKARSTSRARIELAQRDLERVEARIIGSVLSNYASPFR
jgi:Mrp family chromosome partitioning ATPase